MQKNEEIELRGEKYAGVPKMKDGSLIGVQIMMNGKNRNKPCPCGSKKKFKQCHGLKFDGVIIGLSKAPKPSEKDRDRMAKELGLKEENKVK